MPLLQAEPRPNVSWYKDTMLLDPSHHRQMETDGSRHSLVLHHLQVTDFGNYTCLADNGLGLDRASIFLSGELVLGWEVQVVSLVLQADLRWSGSPVPVTLTRARSTPSPGTPPVSFPSRTTASSTGPCHHNNAVLNSSTVEWTVICN